MNLQQKMFQFIEDWKKGGLTKVDFLKNTGITIHKFNYWIDKYSLLMELVERINLGHICFSLLFIN
jgi:hypothetical protein